MVKARAKQRPTPKRSISEEPIMFGEVIASRQYTLGRQKVLLEIGTPHVLSWGTDFYCPYRFVRGGKRTLHRAFGVDSVQALMLVFEAIKVHLELLSPKAG